MKFLTTLIFALSFAGNVLACSQDGSSGILPEHKFKIPVGSKLATGLTQAQFNAVIDKVEPIYAPIVANMGGKLRVNRKWTDGTVNANATQMGKTWEVNMYGGLARHEAITEDGFALVLCHEIGHHLGGAPKVSGFMNRWASNEGQADYFGTLKCLRRVFLNENNASFVRKMRAEAPETLVNGCNKAWPNKDDKDICIRSGLAGLSVANLFAALRGEAEPKFETPDTNVVRKTDDAHPLFQCRLDTYFQGALCEKPFSEDVSQTDEVQGTCHGSTGHKVGVRPLCWFKPSKK
jgi:hypothetical protein